MAKFTDAVQATLTGYFNIGDQPTEAQFAALITAIQEGIDEHDHSGAAGGDGMRFATLGIGGAPTYPFDVSGAWGATFAVRIENTSSGGGINVGGLYVKIADNDALDTVLLCETFDGDVLRVKGNGDVVLTSTTGALLLTRMTTTQRDALTPVNGMILYNTTTNRMEGYENGAWVDI